MSGKFVRASKFRHVFGTEPKKENTFQNLRPNTDGEGNYIVGNKKFFAISIQGGGGPVQIVDLSKPSRLAHDAPKLNVHKSKVVDCDFNPFMDNMIATGSEDCTTRITIFPEEGLSQSIDNANVILEGHLKKIALVKFHPTAKNVLGTCAYDYQCKVWDIEKATALFTVEEHTDMLQSLEWNADGSLLGTTCKDKFIRVFDPRNAKSVVKVEGFQGAKSSRLTWFSNHNKLAVFGFSKSSARQYQVFDPRDMSKPLTEAVEYDQAAGVLVPYYDPDNSILYVGGKGDGTIRYYEVTDDAPFLHYLSEYRSSESQKGLCFLPKLACDYKVCEVAVALRLLRDSVVPISFQVPRKSSGVFQEDIFPDCYAGISAMSADDYAAGTNKAPVTVSIRDANKVLAHQKSEFKAQKSAAQLQGELDAANKLISEQAARIKELEDKLAK